MTHCMTVDLNWMSQLLQEKTKLYPFRMEANIPEQLLTDVRQLCTCTPFIWRTKAQLKEQFSSLVHILAPHIVSTVRPTPNYPNWTTADSSRGRNSCGTFTHTLPPLLSLPCLYNMKTCREEGGVLQRFFTCGWLQCAVQRNTPTCLWYFSPLNYFSMYVSSLRLALKLTTSPHKKSCLFPKTYLVLIYAINIAVNPPLFDSELYLAL